MFEARESRTTVIDAPVGIVYDVITDYENYPSWASSLDRVVVGDGRSVQGDYPEEVEFFGGALGFRVRYRLRYEYDPPYRLSWKLVDGDVKGLLLKFSISSLDGSYEFESVDGGKTRATYSLRISLPVPVGPLRRKAEEIVMDTGLADLKKRAEELACRE